MSNSVKLTMAAKTDAGLVRTHNEDAVLLLPSHCLAVLADGMGGYNAGEVASEMASTIIVQQVQANLPPLAHAAMPVPHADVRRCLLHAILVANDAIVDAARDVPQYQGMGTTVVAAICHDSVVTLAHVGDSRAYRFRRGSLTQLTRDHSLLQEQIDSGLLPQDALQTSRYKNIITRAVGVERDLDVEIRDDGCEPGDLYLLCSDGLSDMLTDEQIADILAMRAQSNLNNPEESLPATCNTLVNSANAHGGRDNISVVLMQVCRA